MTNRGKLRIAGFILAVTAVLVLAAPAAHADVQYTVTQLPLDATALNNAGQIVGAATFAGGYHAALYDGQLHDLGNLGVDSTATAINNLGQIVGNYHDAARVNHAFLYSGGSMQDLGLDAHGSEARAINDAGQIAGFFYAGGLTNHAFVLKGTALNDVGRYALGESFGYGMNSLGHIVGKITNHAIDVPALYASGALDPMDLSALGYDMRGRADDINNSDQVVGTLDFTRYSSPGVFLYQNGAATVLRPPAGSMCAEAAAINNVGVVVGKAFMGSWEDYPDDSFNHAFVYQGGAMLDLNSLIDPASSVLLNSAIDINDAGQILCQRFDWMGNNTYYLLTPIPEPATLGLLALAGSALLARRRR